MVILMDPALLQHHEKASTSSLWTNGKREAFTDSGEKIQVPKVIESKSKIKVVYPRAKKMALVSSFNSRPFDFFM